MPNVRTSRRSRRVWPQNAVNSGAALNQGRVAWWRCMPQTVGGGGTWWDLTGAHHAQASGVGTHVSFNAPPGGHASMAMDSTSGAYLVPNTATGPLAVAQGFSISAWIYPTTFDLIVPEIMSRFILDSDSACDFRIGASGTLQIGGASIIATPSGSLVINTWQRVSVVVLGSGAFAGFAILAINGITQASGNPGLSVGASGWSIGNGYHQSRPFPGFIDDVSLWIRNSVAETDTGQFFNMDYDQALRGHPDSTRWY